MIDRDDVIEARERIARHVRRTPTLPGEGPAAPFFKCEFMQHTGVFKARGAFNRLLAAHERGELDPEVGIVVASGGNAGLANAYAAARLGVPATVFVPVTAPEVKVRRLLSYGATVRQVGLEYAEAYEAAAEDAAARDAVLCHAYDQPDIAAGAGTLALEILDDVPDIDTIVVAVGGGGLFAGVAAAVEGRARVVAVEPVTAPSLREAITAGRPVDVAVSGVAADSLGARRVGEIGFAVAQRTSPVSVLVSDEAIVDARARLWSSYRIPAEHGAAAAYAALTSSAYVPDRSEKVAVVICGANTDPTTFDQVAAGSSRGSDT